MSKDNKKRELDKKEVNAGDTTLFTGLKIESFTKADLKTLNALFSVLASDKRLDILQTTISDSATRLKDLAKKLGDKNSAQIALHAKKLYDAGLLKKEGASLRDSREYIPTIAKETYIFLRLALIYAQILQSQQTELELEKLKENAQAACEKLANSHIGGATSTLLDMDSQYEASLKLTQEVFQKLVTQFAKIVNVNEL